MGKGITPSRRTGRRGLQRHNAPIQKDFLKVKQKVGKKKIVQNATQTEFRSRNIHMPNQGGLATKQDSELLTQRKLNLADLLARLQHHNASMRRQGLEGLRELAELATRPDTTREDPIKQELGRVLQSVCKLITDDEGSVRSTMVGVMSVLFTHYPASSLEPHLKLVGIYICNGMTHLQKSIRLQALEVLDLMTTHVPSLVVHLASEFVPNYLYLLVLATRSVNNSVQSSETFSTALAGALQTAKSDAAKKKAQGNNLRLRIVKSLLKFLRAFFRYSRETSGVQGVDEGSQQMVWGVQAQGDGASFGPQAGRQIAEWLPRVLSQVREDTARETLALAQVWQRKSASAKGAVRDANGNWWHTLRDEEEINQFALQLTPILVDYWMEALPTEFPNTTDNLLMMQHILEILALVHTHCHDLHSHQHPADRGVLGMLQRYVFAHFPYQDRVIRLPGEQRAVNLSDQFNHSVCIIAKRFLTVESLEEPWTQRLISFIITSLEEAHEGIQPLLGLVEQFFTLSLGKSTRDIPALTEPLWESFTTYYVALPAASAMKRACLLFIQRILRLKYGLRDSRAAASFIGTTIESQWLTSFPRLLFKLKGKTLQATAELILDILLEYAEHIQTPAAQSLFDQIQPRFHPFFFGSAGGKEFPGPFIKASPAIQKKAVFVIYYFSRLTPCLLNALVKCCRRGASHFPNDVVGLVLEVVSLKRETLSVPEFLSFLLNLMRAMGTQHVNWTPAQHQVAHQQVELVLSRMRLMLHQLPYHARCVHILGPSVCYLFQECELNQVQMDSLLSLYAISISSAEISLKEEDVAKELATMLKSSHRLNHQDIVNHFRVPYE